VKSPIYRIRLGGFFFWRKEDFHDEVNGRESIRYAVYEYKVSGGIGFA
jgi:hypothetical protein